MQFGLKPGIPETLTPGLKAGAIDEPYNSASPIKYQLPQPSGNRSMKAKVIVVTRSANYQLPQ
ncbi:MAG TPA: hypothetical protein VIU13_11840, partial [Chryseolinea sp.]